MCPHGYYGWGGWGLTMAMGMLLFWVAVGVGLYFIYKTMAYRGIFGPSPAPAGDTPRAILDRRLAAGEISPDDYDNLRRKLEGS